MPQQTVPPASIRKGNGAGSSSHRPITSAHRLIHGIKVLASQTQLQEKPAKNRENLALFERSCYSRLHMYLAQEYFKRKENIMGCAEGDCCANKSENKIISLPKTFDHNTPWKMYNHLIGGIP